MLPSIIYLIKSKLLSKVKCFFPSPLSLGLYPGLVSTAMLRAKECVWGIEHENMTVPAGLSSVSSPHSTLLTAKIAPSNEGIPDWAWEQRYLRQTTKGFVKGEKPADEFGKGEER